MNCCAMVCGRTVWWRSGDVHDPFAFRALEDELGKHLQKEEWERRIVSAVKKPIEASGDPQSSDYSPGSFLGMVISFSVRTLKSRVVHERDYRAVLVSFYTTHPICMDHDEAEGLADCVLLWHKSLPKVG